MEYVFKIAEDHSLLLTAVFSTSCRLPMINSSTICNVTTHPTHEVIDEGLSSNPSFPYPAQHTSTYHDSPEILAKLVVSCQMFQSTVDDVIPKTKTARANYSYTQEESICQILVDTMSLLKLHLLISITVSSGLTLGIFL